MSGEASDAERPEGATAGPGLGDALAGHLSCEILTLFPEMISGYARASILGRAVARGLVKLGVLDIRDFAEDRHRTVDDVPYGGGAGMVMKPGPLIAAVEEARRRLPGAPVILLSPRGARFDQARARGLRERGRLILVCGRYEGVDERALAVVDEEISLGDFVLTGGELAALCVLDAVARLVPGVLGNADSAAAESFVGGLLEHPHYTRPPVFRGVSVPSVLLSGDHRRIARWRRGQALLQTRARRPDLFEAVALTLEDRQLLAESGDAAARRPSDEQAGQGLGPVDARDGLAEEPVGADLADARRREGGL